MKKLIAILMISTLFAQVPHKMSFQAYLTDSNNMPVAPGSYDITFRIYDAMTDGTKIWEETQTVTVDGSMVNAMLGATVPLVPIGKSGYLEIQLKDDILSPRQEIGASMFSLQAHTALRAPGYAKLDTLSFYAKSGDIVANTDNQALSLSGDTLYISNGNAVALAPYKDTFTTGQASAIVANTAKTGITTDQASAIVANTGKTGITADQASAITANTAKTGITTDQASAIVANTGKTGDTGARGAAGTNGTDGAKGDTGAAGAKGDQGIQGIQGPQGDIGLTGSAGAKGATGAAGAKGDTGLTADQITAVNAISGTNTGDQDISGITTNATAIALNTAKTGITTDQSTAITNNTAKVGVPTAYALPTTDGSGSQVLQTDGSGAVSWATAGSYLPLSGGSLTGDITLANGNAFRWTSDDVRIEGTTAGDKILFYAGGTERLSIAQTGGATFADNISTSGTITAGAITIPNTDGTSGQVLQTNGSGALSWATSSGGASNVTGLSDALVESNSIYLGKDPSGTTSNANYNVSLGISALNFITTGDNNVAVGFQSLYANTTGYSNTAIGDNVMRFNIDGFRNTAIGTHSLYKNTTGQNNVSNGGYSLANNTTGSNSSAFGYKALYNSTGSNNTGIGYQAGDLITTGTNNVIIGKDADPSVNSATNQIVIGYNAVGAGNNTVQLGNTAVTNVKTSGTLTAGAITIPNTDGTSGQVLSTNGSGAVSWTNAPTGTVSSLSDLSVTATASELNIMDGSATTQATVTLVGTDGIVISDGDIMKQALMSDIKTYVEGGSGVTHNQVVIDSWSTPTTELAIGDLKFRVDNGYLEWKSNTGSSINFDMEVTLKKDGSGEFGSFPTTPKVGHDSSEAATTSWTQVVGSSVGGAGQSNPNNVGLWYYGTITYELFQRSGVNKSYTIKTAVDGGGKVFIRATYYNFE